MTPSPMARLRRLWLDVHLWIGVGLSLVFIPLGLTGSALVFHGGLDRALHAERYAVSGPEARLSLAAYAEAARSAFGDRARLSQLRLPQEPGDPVVAVGRMAGAGPAGRPRSLNAWIDPPTGRVLAVGEAAGGLTMTLHRLHGTLFVPQVGRRLVGWMGWAMFASCATGLWLWWPRRGGFLRGLRWRRGASQLFNLHHVIGFWICIPLAALSLTGVYIAFPQSARALFGVAEPSGRGGDGGPRGGPGGRFAAPAARTRIDLAQAVARALDGRTDAKVASITLPAASRAPAWRIALVTPRGETTVQVADADGTVTEAPPRGEGGPDATSRWMRRIHDGQEMGMVWRLVIFAAGIAPTLLGITGLVMWLRRRGRRRALAALS